MLTEIKRPEIGPNADELTSLTRGRGPRRGNLEALLRYWRPIMKKPGGFRRCLVILANHPELYPLERICAWLHHETTGKWPNEGKKKRRGRGRGNVSRRRRRKLTRSVRRGTRRKKSVDFTENIVEISAMRLAIRESRDIGGVLTQPIAGRQAAVELKAMMFNQYSMTLPVEGEVKRVGIVGSRTRAGQAVQAVGSIILPGDISDIRSPIRSQIYETLTPGGGRDRIPSARRLLRGAGRGARNKFRCPPGFQKGGTFTNREFSTCGAQVLGIPSIGPGAPSEGAQRALARLARSAELVREIGDLRKNRSSYDIIRAAQIPVAPKKGSATRRQTSVDLVLARIGEQEFGTRFVRRDGVILEPVVSLQALGSMDEFDDMVDGSLVDRYSSGQIGKDLIPAFGAGLRDVYIGIPDTSTVVKVSRDGGELNPTEMDAVQRVYPTSLRRTADLPDPSASIYALSEATNGRFDVEVGELKNNRYQKAADTKNERIRVQSGRQTLMVPRWVYETFLSRSAPRRAKGDPIFEIVESQGKSLNPFMISTKSALEVANKDVGYHDTIEMRTALFAESRLSANTEVKRIGRRLRRGATPGGGRGRPNVPGGGGGGRARAIFDPNIDGFRCPPGTRNAGQFSDQFGRNCGYSLPRQIVNNLVDLGMKIEDAMERRRLRREERGSVRERLGAAYRERLARVEDGLAKVMDRLADVLDVTEDRNLGRIGPTLEQRRRRADLTPEQRDLLEGGELRDALQNMQNVLEERDFDDADITDIRKAFKQVEKAAQLEAGRLTDNPARNRNQRNIRARIQEAISRMLDRLANLIDDRTDRRGNRRDRRDRVDAPRADVVPNRRRRGTPARRIRNTDATAPEANDRNVGNRLGRRNRGVDVPELRELNDDQKSRVNRAIQNEFNDLGDYWARLLGVDEPTDVEIRRYLRRDRRNQGSDRRIKERRYRDWLELNEVLQKIDNGDEDIDYEDFVGRLAPNRRDSIVNRIDPPQRPRRQRRERREAPPVDAPEANTPDADTPPVPDADTPDPDAPDGDIVEIVNQFSPEDWAVQDDDELDRIESALNGRMGEYLGVPNGPPPPRAFGDAMDALRAERNRRANIKRKQSDIPLADRDEQSINRELIDIDGELIAIGGARAVFGRPRNQNARQRELYAERDRLQAELDRREALVSNAQSSVQSAPAANNPPVRSVLVRSWRRIKERKIEKRQKQINRIAEDRYGEDRPFEIKDAQGEGLEAFRRLSQADQELYLRRMYSDGVEMDGGTTIVDGVTYRKTVTPNVTQVTVGGNGDFTVYGDHTYKVYRVNADGSEELIADERIPRDWPYSGFARSGTPSVGEASHSTYGVKAFYDLETGRFRPANFQNNEAPKGIDFRGGGIASEFNTNAMLFYRGLGIEGVNTGPADDGVFIWAAQGFRAKNAPTIRGLNSDMGEFLEEARGFEAAVREGRIPTGKQLQAGFIVQNSDPEVLDRVAALVEVGRQAGDDADEMPGHFEYIDALSPRDANGVLGRNPAAALLFKRGIVAGDESDDSIELRSNMLQYLNEQNVAVDEDDITRILRTNDALNVREIGSAQLDISGLKLPRSGPEVPEGRTTQVGPRRTGVVRRPVDTYRRLLGRGNRNNRAIVVDDVPVGANGINNKDDAVAYMAQGGGGALADVPDVFLRDAITNNPDRFERVGTAGGVNGMDRYYDKDTGAFLGIKFGGGEAAGFNEAYNEMAGNALAERLGFPVGQMRLDGPATSAASPQVRGMRGDRQTPTPVLIVELAQNVYGLDRSNVRANMQSPDAANPRSGSLSSRVRMSLLDMVIGNSDRHRGNYFRMRRAGGRNFDLYPIDMGLGGAAGLYSPRDQRGVNLDGTPVQRMGRWRDSGMGGGRNGIIRAMRNDVLRSEANRTRVRNEIDRALQQLRANNEQLGGFRDEINEIADISGHAPEERSVFDQGMNIVNENYDWLLSASVDDVYDLLFG